MTRQDAAVTSAVKAFVNAYNATQAVIKAQTNDANAPLNREQLLRTTRGTLAQTVLTPAATVLAEWTLRDLYPLSWSLAELDPKAATVVIETLELTHGGFLDAGTTV